MVEQVGLQFIYMCVYIFVNKAVKQLIVSWVCDIYRNTELCNAVLVLGMC